MTQPVRSGPLEWALGEAAVHQCTVRLVHAIPPIQSLYPDGMGEMAWLDDINEQAEKAARELLDAALAQAGGAPAGVAVERVTQFAPAASGGQVRDHGLHHLDQAVRVRSLRIDQPSDADLPDHGERRLARCGRRR